jgi:hypothetical protein
MRHRNRSRAFIKPCKGEIHYVTLTGLANEDYDLFPEAVIAGY